MPGFNNSLQDGSDIKIVIPSPEQTEKIKSHVEILAQDSISGNSYGRLVGWAFLLTETDQANYERIITLESDSGVYYFPTIPIDRPDVEKSFEDLKLNLGLSGFKTYFRKNELPYGIYDMGIVFLDKAGGATFYSKMDTLLIWSPNKFELYRK